MNRIIVLAGQAGAGKDTAADVFREYGYCTASLAEPIKQMLDVLLFSRGAGESAIYEMLYGKAKEEPTPLLNGATPRQAMQTLGTEWGRKLSPTFWLDTWRDSWHNYAFPMVTTDCRFENEAAYLKALGAKVYVVRRPGFTLTSGAQQLHASEDLSWADGEEVIWNDFPSAKEFQDSVRARFFP